MQINIPNSLTWARIALIPLFVGVFYLPEGWADPQEKNLVATLIFIVAAVTDWFDGYLARALNQTARSTADFDAGKVQAVRTAIEKGTFSVNADAIADKMLSNAAEILARSRG